MGASSLTVSASAVNPPTTLTLMKVLAPSNDPGTFNLQIDGVTRAANVGNGGTTASQVTPGSHSVSETPAGSTNPANYTSSINCGAGSVSGTSTTVTLALGDNKVCTITNLGPPRLTVNKVLQPSSDPGLFNLQIDGTTLAPNVGNGGSTGAQAMSVGSHTIGESPAAGTNPANYAASIDCGEGSMNGTSTTVTLVQGDNKVCTITNRLPQLTVNKVSAPGDPGLFNLQIDGVTLAANVGHGGSTGPQLISVGNHTVGETPGSGTTPTNYSSSTDCGAGPKSGTSTVVSLAPGDKKVCTITNVPKPKPPSNLQVQPH